MGLYPDDLATGTTRCFCQAIDVWDNVASNRAFRRLTFAHEIDLHVDNDQCRRGTI